MNTFLPLIVPKLLATDAFFVFLMVQFIRGLPRELDEAARIDGAGHPRIFLRVILPLMLPALATTTIFTFIWTWNDFFSQLIYLTDPDKYTVPVALRSFVDSTVTTSWGSMFAMSVVSLTPDLPRLPDRPAIPDQGHRHHRHQVAESRLTPHCTHRKDILDAYPLTRDPPSPWPCRSPPPRPSPPAVTAVATPAATSPPTRSPCASPGGVPTPGTSAPSRSSTCSHKAHPNITVKGEFKDWNGYWDSLATTVAANDAPDIIQMDELYLASYAERGALLDLGTASKHLSTGDFDANALDTGKVDGKQYALPVGLATYSIVVNTDLLAQVQGRAARRLHAGPGTTSRPRGAQVSKASGGKVTGVQSWGFDAGGAQHLGPAGRRLPLRRRRATWRSRRPCWPATGSTSPTWPSRASRRSPSVTIERAGAALDQSGTATNTSAFATWWNTQLTSLAAASGQQLKLLKLPGESKAAAPGAYYKPSMFWSISSRSEHPAEAALFVDFLANNQEAADILLTDRGVPANAKIRTAITLEADRHRQGRRRVPRRDQGRPRAAGHPERCQRHRSHPQAPHRGGPLRTADAAGRGGRLHQGAASRDRRGLSRPPTRSARSKEQREFMPQNTYATAIVGTGAIAAAHARALRSRRTGAAGRGGRPRPGPGPGLRRSPGMCPRSIPGLTELLRCADVDLFHLCTPPASHAPLALECLRAGKTVLVEKPPTLSLAELDALADAARRTGAHVATVFQHRFGAGAVRLRAMAAAGELGRPLLATCETQWYRDDAYFDVPWRGRWDTEGGGPTMGHGIHQFDLLLSVLGPWESVTAVAARRARQVETEDVSLALVTFADGTVAIRGELGGLAAAGLRAALRLRARHGRAVAPVRLHRRFDWTVTPAPGHAAVADPLGAGSTVHRGKRARRPARPPSSTHSTRASRHPSPSRTPGRRWSSSPPSTPPPSPASACTADRSARTAPSPSG